MAKVVHFEVPFDDKARAMKFYTDALHWQLQDMPQMNYVMARTTPIGPDQMPTEPGAINGGLNQRPAEAPAPVIYVDVPSIDEAVSPTSSTRIVAPTRSWNRIPATPAT